MSDTVLTYSVLGAARSGVAVARLLHSQGARVFVSDAGHPDPAHHALTVLKQAGIEYETGGHTDRVLQCDTLVLSPGVPDTIPVVAEARRRGITVTNELEVASRLCRGTIVAITGTNGKTTTTELLGHMLRSSGRVTFLAGNIGLPLSEVAGRTTDDCVIVTEVSSFQLEHISTFRPHVALLLNIRPNHLDRYTDFGQYAGAKYRITMNQTPADTLIVNLDDEIAPQILEHSAARQFLFSAQQPVEQGAFLHDGVVYVRQAGQPAEPVIKTDAIRIRGWHNLYNAMAATLAARALDVPPGVIADSLATFGGVPHRLEAVRTLDGVRYVNDSKATTVDALWWALQSFDEQIVLIAGGRGKKNDYTAVVPLAQKHVKAIVVMGDAQDEMEAAFGGHTQVLRAGYDLKQAVGLARGLAAPGDVVLLSPACTSFDMFRNFEDRGDRFKELVNELTTGPNR